MSKLALANLYVRLRLQSNADKPLNEVTYNSQSDTVVPAPVFPGKFRSFSIVNFTGFTSKKALANLCVRLRLQSKADKPLNEATDISFKLRRIFVIILLLF